MPLRAVTLDAGGTLIEVAEPVGTTYARIARRYGIPLDARELDGRFREVFTTAPPLAFPDVPPAQLEAAERGWWEAIVRRAFGTSAHHPAFSACFAELYAHFARKEAWQVFADVLPTLRALRARQLRIAVLSNFDQRLVTLLADLGLAPLIDHVVHSTATGAAKPDVAFFDAALAILHTSAEETLHVGDGLGEDVEGARAAGFHAVLLDRSGRRGAIPASTPRIVSLTQLPTLVAALA
jgi:putative hydrolase of the HAD superfamily